MKEGLNIQPLVAEVKRQSQSKQDFIARTNTLTMDYMRGYNILTEADAIVSQAAGTRTALALAPTAITTPTQHRLVIPGQGAVTLNSVAHDQLGTHLGIPSRYYDRLQEGFPGLLAENVNTLLAAAPKDEYRTVRTLDGKARAFLSDAYEALDNYDLIRFLLPLFAPRDTPLRDGSVIKCLRNPDGSPLDVTFRSCDLTEQKLYIKVIAPTIVRELKVGATVRAGVIIQNSEVGLGALCVFPFYEVLQCTNGAFFTNFGGGNKRRHVGGRKGSDVSGNEAARFFSDATKAAKDKAFFLQMADVVRGTMTEAMFRNMTEPMVASMAVALTGHPEAAVREVGKRYDIGDEAQDEIVRFLIDGGDLSQWGISNAVTRYAQDSVNYDEATRLEGIGGDIITLTPAEFRVMAEAKNTARTRRA